ncbi:MAG: hypothetical protein ACRDZO_20630 [Egibacteraceae bacterium]
MITPTNLRLRTLDTVTGHEDGFFSPDAYYGPLDLWLRGVAGRVAGLAGRLDEAEQLLGDELAEAVTPWAQRRILSDLSRVRVENGEPEGLAKR